MSRTVLMETESETVPLVLEDESVEKLGDELPLESRTSTWGDEIYFAIPVELSNENQTLNPEIGDVAYWPEGQSLCIFYGPTPLSEDDQPVAADEISIIGFTDVPPEKLRSIEAGESITLHLK